MTRTVVFSGHNHLNTAVGNSTASGASISSLLRKVFGATPVAVNGGNSSNASDWMTADIRRNLTPRAQRLMRADY